MTLEIEKKGFKLNSYFLLGCTETHSDMYENIFTKSVPLSFSIEEDLGTHGIDKCSKQNFVKFSSAKK